MLSFLKRELENTQNIDFNTNEMLKRSEQAGGYLDFNSAGFDKKSVIPATAIMQRLMMMKRSEIPASAILQRMMMLKRSGGSDRFLRDMMPLFKRAGQKVQFKDKKAFQISRLDHRVDVLEKFVQRMANFIKNQGGSAEKRSIKGLGLGLQTNAHKRSFDKQQVTGQNRMGCEIS